MPKRHDYSVPSHHQYQCVAHAIANRKYYIYSQDRDSKQQKKSSTNDSSSTAIPIEAESTHVSQISTKILPSKNIDSLTDKYQQLLKQTVESSEYHLYSNGSLSLCPTFQGSNSSLNRLTNFKSLQPIAEVKHAKKKVKKRISDFAYYRIDAEGNRIDVKINNGNDFLRFLDHYSASPDDYKVIKHNFSFELFYDSVYSSNARDSLYLLSKSDALCPFSLMIIYEFYKLFKESSLFDFRNSPVFKNTLDMAP